MLDDVFRHSLKLGFHSEDFGVIKHYPHLQLKWLIQVYRENEENLVFLSIRSHIISFQMS